MWSSMFGGAQEEQKQQEPEGFVGRALQILPNESSFMYAMIFFGVSALMLLFALMNIFSIVTNPGRFTTIFNLAVMAAMTGLAYYRGPR